MGLVNEGYPVFVCQNALDDSGYVLTLDTTNGGVKKATDSDEVIGVALTGTVDMFGNAVSGENVAIAPVGRALIVELQLDSSNLAISYGDPLCVDASTAGVVDLKDDATNTGDRIAIALEDKAENSGGKIKALLL